MALPTQLQKQIDDAKVIADQLYAPKSETTDANPAESSANTTVETPTEAPAAVTEAAPTTPVVATPVETSVTQTEDENGPTYAQRWRSLQGTFNAQKRHLDETAQRLANMEQLVAQMQVAPAAAEQKAASRPAHVTDKDVSEYGSDMVEFARRVSREEMAPLAQAVQALIGRIDQLQGVVPVVRQVADTQAKTAHDKFYEQLGTKVSDWQEINEQPRFHDWLLSEDPLSGLQRQTLLTDAHKSLNLDRVVNFFNQWKRENGAVTAPAVAAQAAQQASNASKLERQIAPGRASAGSAPPAASAKKQWSRPEIAQFFADKMNGRYKGREAESRSLESDIFLAQREGRVAQNAA
jgi:hypothetical protein